MQPTSSNFAASAPPTARPASSSSRRRTRAVAPGGPRRTRARRPRASDRPPRAPLAESELDRFGEPSPYFITERRRLSVNKTLDSRGVIDRPRGMLAERSGTRQRVGLLRLRSYARNHNARLADVARDVVLDSTLPLKVLDPAASVTVEYPRSSSARRTCAPACVEPAGDVRSAIAGEGWAQRSCPQGERPLRRRDDIPTREELEPACEPSQPRLATATPSSKTRPPWSGRTPSAE